MKSWVLRTSAVLALSGFVTACGGTADGATAPVKGAMAPTFQLKTVDGQRQVSLKELLAKGEPVVLNAFASWCDPCKQETPEFVKAAQKYQGKVQFVGVNMTTTETAKGDVAKFVSQYHVSYPVLMDASGKFMNDYRVFGFPTTFVLAPSGKIVAVEQQAISAAQLDSDVQAALHSS